MPTWEVAGFVLGPAMPDMLEIIPGRVAIWRLGEGERRIDTRVQLKHPEPTGPGAYLWSVLPGQERVASDWIFWIHVEAESDDEAEEKARDHDLPILLASLQCLGLGDYAVVPVRVGQVTSAEGWSIGEPGHFRFVDAKPVEPRLLADATAIAADLETAPLGPALAKQYARALARLRTATEPDDEWIALLEMYKVLESIAGEVGGPVLDADERRKAEDLVATRLAEQLADLAGSERITAITDAALALNDIRHERAATRLRQAGAVLQLEQDLIDAMVEANRARANYGAHALTGRSGTVGQLYRGGMPRLNSAVAKVLRAYGAFGSQNPPRDRRSVEPTP